MKGHGAIVSAQDFTIRQTILGAEDSRLVTSSNEALDDYCDSWVHTDDSDLGHAHLICSSETTRNLKYF